MNIDKYQDSITNVSDFPIKGIQFKDITKNVSYLSQDQTHFIYKTLKKLYLSHIFLIFPNEPPASIAFTIATL